MGARNYKPKQHVMEDSTIADGWSANRKPCESSHRSSQYARLFVILRLIRLTRAELMGRNHVHETSRPDLSTPSDLDPARDLARRFAGRTLSNA